MNESKQFYQNRQSVKALAIAAVTAALYLILTYALAPISFLAWQFRLSEVLMILPLFSFASVPGLVVGCLLANFLNPQSLGLIDIIFGTVATALAALVTYVVGRYLRKAEEGVPLNRKKCWAWRLLAPLPSVVFNGLIVGSYLPILLLDPSESAPLYVLIPSTMLSIAISEAVVVYLLGIPLYLTLRQLPFFKRI